MGLEVGISYILLLFFIFNFLLHLYWSFGGKWGAQAVIPYWKNKPLLQLWPVPTFILSFFFLIPVVIITDYLGLTSLIKPYFNVLNLFWLLFCVFMLRAIGDFRVCGLFKKETSTVFAKWDSKLFSPLCAFVALMFFYLIVEIKTL